ncbi:MAG: tetratricopeptide repeat protein [Anaerolineales bacterium]
MKRRGLHIGAVLILLVALGVTAYPAALVDNLESAATAMLAGRPDLALPALNDAIALEPDIPELHLRAAQGALTAEDPDLAIEFLNHLPESEPGLECLQLDAALRAGKMDAALAQLPGSRCPEQAAMFYEEADLLVAAGDYQAAADMLKSLLASLPATPEASETLGTLLALQDPEGALSHLRLAVDLDPRTRSFADELIQVIESARSDGNQAYTLAQVGQTLARRGRWSMAVAAFENALALDPGYTEARAYYGLALDRSGQDGLSQLERAVAEAPQAPLPLVLLGKHWLLGGEPERALEAYEQAATLAPGDPLIAIDLGAAYAAAGDLPAAKLAYQYATDLAPDDATMWSMFAQFSLDYEIELTEVGLPAARQAVLLKPRDAATLDRLGYTHFLLGNLTLAERFILRAIETDGSLASARYHLGLLGLATGDLIGGRGALASALALDPDGRYGNLARRSLENLDQ